jgi:hypothetical protein
LQTELDGKALSTHTHTLSDITDSGTSAALNVPAAGDAAAGEVVKGDDTRLTDARTPTAHTHIIADVTGLQTELDGKADGTHTHIINDVTGLQAALDTKAPLAHTHIISDITNLQTELDGKSDVGHTHVIADVTGLQAELDSKVDGSHTHDIVDITNLTSELGNKVETSLIGQPNGIASLNSSGQVPPSQLPSYVDDVLEFVNVASFPAVGEANKIYIATDTNKSYRWSGSQYVEIANYIATWGTIAGVLSDQIDLQAALDAKADSSHTHIINDVTGLQTELDGKADVSHTHTASEITDFDTEVSNNASVTANTAKVSADGSVTTHSDVTDAGSGQIITNAERSKLAGIEANAKDDQSALEVPYDNSSSLLTAGNVQAAIDEVEDRVDTLESAGAATWGTITGTLSNQTDLQSALDGKANTTHTHTLSDVTDSGTSAALDVAAVGDAGVGEVVKGDDTRLTDARTPTAHTHTASEITDFDTEVSNNSSVAANTAKVSADGSVTTHSDVTSAGSGEIITTAERNKLAGIEANAKDDQSALEVPYDNSSSLLTATTAQAAIDELDTAVDSLVTDSHTHANKAQLDLITDGDHDVRTDNPHGVTKTQVGLGNVTNDAQIPLTEKGAINGVATLDGSGLVPSAQLPSYVDDVLEFANLAGFPGTGETGKIYLALDTNKIYRWSGSVYVEVADVGAEWGSITGTLSNQTDLQSALDGKANTTHTHVAADITDFDTEVSNNTSVAANTAKVSADGSVTTHSDVTDAGSGAIITTAERNKLAGIEAGAEVNNISDVNATDLTDAGDTSLHFHSSDRDRANHTGTQTASTISDFDTEVSNNTSVAANTAKETNVTTNLGIANRGTETLDITSSDGIDATVPAATTSLTGLLTSTDKTKLDGIENGATNNVLASQAEVDAGVEATKIVTPDTLEDKTYGTFTGVTIGDNVTLKTALQQLETKVEQSIVASGSHAERFDLLAVTVAPTWQLIGTSVPYVDALLEVVITNDDNNPHTVGVRATGSPLNRSFFIAARAAVTMTVISDALGNFETFNNNEANISFTVVSSEQ